MYGWFVSQFCLRFLLSYSLSSRYLLSLFFCFCLSLPLSHGSSALTLSLPHSSPLSVFSPLYSLMATLLFFFFFFSLYYSLFLTIFWGDLLEFNLKTGFPINQEQIKRGLIIIFITLIYIYIYKYLCSKYVKN